GNAGDADGAEEFAGSGDALLDRADVEDAVERNAARVDGTIVDFLRIRRIIGQNFSCNEAGPAAGSVGCGTRFRRAGEGCKLPDRFCARNALVGGPESVVSAPAVG